jgi:beta-glucanase (GH16 family)
MTKFLLLLSASLLSFSALAQTIEDDFEGNGTINAWVGDDCNVDPDFTNPFSNVNNPSSGVLQYADVGGSFANVRFDVGANLDLSDNHTFSLKIYVASADVTGNQPNQVSLKLQDGTLAQPWVTQTEVIKPIVLDEWQTISFDFRNDNFINLDAGSPDPVDRDDLNRVLIQINGENNNDQVTAYIDDFSYDGSIPTPEPEVDYTRLIWSDEFDEGPQLDTSKWHQQTLLPNGNSWYNNEVQHYTDRVENSFVEDGKLHIRAIKETFTDQGVTKEYTSARLNSKFAFTRGKVEVRAKLPTGGGTWPAIWTLGKNIDEPGGYWQPTHGTVPWPACGEIDIMEHWGHNQNYVSSALHTPSSFGGTVNVGGMMNPTASDSFHVYSMIWSEDKIRFFLDGFNFYTYDPEVQNMDTWPFIADQYILLNIAIEPSIDPQFTQSDMVIDYVRVYGEEAPQSTGFIENDEQFDIYPNPATDMVHFNLPVGMSNATVAVYSLEGLLISSRSAKGRYLALETEGLSKGVYIVRASSQNRAIQERLILR